MASKCFMCGAAISHGILCEKCDTPKKAKAKTETGKTPIPQLPSEPPASAPPPKPAPQPMAAKSAAPTAAHAAAPAPAAMVDELPKAQVVHFPVESASPAISSLAQVLLAAGAAGIVLAPDRSVKFVTEEAKKLFGVAQADLGTVKQLEALTGIRIGELSVPASSPIRVRNRSVIYTLVPLSGGASGAVLVFKYADSADDRHVSFVNFVRETVLLPMRSLRDSLTAVGLKRRDPLLDDWASTVDQVLTSLELAPEVQEPAQEHRTPKVTEVVRIVAQRFQQFADLKGIQLQVDVPDLEERFRNHEQLADALGILMDNSLHYVPAGGQVVIGVRWMEHKGRPLLLFFVMDNGPVVPEELRSAIFEPNFVWNPSAPDRSGRSLFKVREFAVAHAGSVWVESKSGKACTFFLRVRPDSAR